MVCAVTRGEADPEPVRAYRTHAGTQYGFCSEKCAREFAHDPVAYLPPTFPRPAPSFALQTLSGDSLSTDSLRGQIVLVDFWATWCGPCRKSMPDIQALHEKYAGRKFLALGVSIDEGGPAKVKRLVASKRFTYPIALDAARAPAWEAFRVKAIPAAYLIDRQGQIVAQWTGKAASAEELEAKLQELLATD